MNPYQENFRRVMSTRNKAQKEAIQKIDGPVMVIAGPGSGKTDVLSLRIGHILNQEQINPWNILCLTYTDAGVTAMKRRLLKYIGPDAYQAHIFTFHSLCNKIIQENIEIFGGYQELQLRSELEHIKIMKTIIDELPRGHPFKRLSGNIYFDKTRIENLFRLMKQENWSPQFFVRRVDQYLEEARLSPEMYYKRNTKNNKKGDFKEKDWQKLNEKYNKSKAAAQLFEQYEKKLAEQKRYDYNDMILWVLRAFEQHPDLLSDYQEQYQYIMVDEFQDTNGSQLELVNQIASYWENPNLFVVGDDDQAIYKFQGANKQNIQNFIKKYRPAQIIMDTNYRSSANILGPAMQLINHNIDRIAVKELKAAGLYADHPSKVQINIYNNSDQEEADLLQRLKNLYQSDQVKAHDSVAVIYRKHIHAERIISALEKLNIPFELKKEVNVLHQPLIRQILNILHYVHSETHTPGSEDYRLAELMHYRFFNIPASDIAKVVLHYNKNKRTQLLSELLDDEKLLDELALKAKQQIVAFKSVMDTLVSEVYEHTLQSYFEKVLHQTSIIDMILRAHEQTWLLQLINSVMKFIKDETMKTPTMDLGMFLDYIDEMIENNISLPLIKSYQSEAGIQLMTAHGAKGLEMDHIFIFGATKDRWDNPRGPNANLPVPPNLIGTQDEHSLEDDRRLFYVAMTRARKELCISLATSSGKKELLPSTFVEEIKDHHKVSVNTIQVDEQLITDFFVQPFQSTHPTKDWIDRDSTKKIVEHYVLNVTGLNKYLKCPVSFYFENILRVPSAKNANSGFGSAVHYALERFFNHQQFDKKNILLDYFKRGMDRFKAHFTEREYQDRLDFGLDELAAYYDHYHPSWSQNYTYITELNIQAVHHKSVPLAGKIDLLVFDGTHSCVFDFKTGSYQRNKIAPPEASDNPGSDYWRQVIFYKILLNAESHRRYQMDKGIVDFVQRDAYGNFIRKEIPLNPEHIDLVSQQICDTYEQIRKLNFEQGCNECNWCQLKAELIHDDKESELGK